MHAEESAPEEPIYEVVWPLGKVMSVPVELAPALSDLNGKTICEIGDGGFRGDAMYPIIREELKKRYPGIKIVDYKTMGNPRANNDQEYLANLPKVLREHDCDAVISSVGACGSCTPAVTRVSVAVEKAGIPTVSIITTPFVALSRAVAKGQGITDLAIAEYPGVPLVDSDEQLRAKVLKLLPQILDGLVNRKKAGPQAASEAEPQPRDIVFKGIFQEIQDFFDEKLWSDGLPVVPPTIKAIEQFLKFTDRSPDEVIGICYPEARAATVWNTAVNGVMAGCRPEYMPVLVAVVEAMTDPEFFLRDAGATPGWEPLIILNGPIIKDLDFNYGSGVLRVGRRANTSVGRFARLFMRNLPGHRIPAPGLKYGGTDKATIGMTFNVVLAEDEDAIDDVGWQPFSVDQGFARGDNVVTVQSVVSVSQPTYTAGTEAIKHMEIIAEVIGHTFLYRSYGAIRHGHIHPLIVMSPSVAKAITDDGWSKADIQQYLYDHLKMPAVMVEKYARNATYNDYDLKDLVERKMIPSEYYESDDPNRMVRALVKPEWTGIVVAGDPGRNQSKGFVQHHRRGVPTSKKIALPRNWQKLLRQRKVH